MKDTLAPSPENRTKIMFYDTEDRQTRLRIRCQHDGITQSQFFRMMISGYIDGDQEFLDFLDKQKEKYNTQGKDKRNKLTRMRKSAKKHTDKFLLDDTEKESIFDIIESETNL